MAVLEWQPSNTVTILDRVHYIYNYVNMSQINSFPYIDGVTHKSLTQGCHWLEGHMISKRIKLRSRHAWLRK